MPRDRYQQLTRLPPGRLFARRLGLPESVPLRRYEPGQPALAGPGPDRRRGPHGGGARRRAGRDRRAGLPGSGAGRGGRRSARSSSTPPGSRDSEGLRALYDFFHPAIRSLGAERAPRRPRHAARAAADRRQAVAQRALEGFVRSAAKELRRGATGQLVLVAPAPRPTPSSTLRFLLSAPLGLRLRPGGPRRRRRVGRRRRTGSPAGRPRRRGHRRLARHRRGDRARRWRATARSSSASTCPPRARTLAALVNAIGGASLLLDITGADAPAAAGRARARAPRRRRRARPQRGRDPRPHARADVRGRSGTWCSRST